MNNKKKRTNFNNYHIKISKNYYHNIKSKYFETLGLGLL